VVAVGVGFGAVVAVGVGFGVVVAVGVGFGVLVGVFAIVAVGILVGVFVIVAVGILVGVFVIVAVGVFVIVAVGGASVIWGSGVGGRIGVASTRLTSKQLKLNNKASPRQTHLIFGKVFRVIKLNS
jgi:hypothetical protein